MNVWKLIGPKRLIHTEEPLPGHEDGKIRIRVTKVLVNSLDVNLFDGTAPCKYPLIPGRYAVGVIAEDGAGVYLPRGTRVLLHTFRPIDPSGVEKRDFSAPEYEVCGHTQDGFLTDFVNVSPRDFTALPPSVSDERALLLHHVAIAKAVCDHLGSKKGQHIVVVGANLVGILVCQLLIYQQAAPILVDTVQRHLDFAKKCGVYYTVLADSKALDSVASITGGRLADGAVYISSAIGNAPELPFRLAARSTNVVLYGQSAGGLKVSLDTAVKKHLAIYCVDNGYGYLDTAINLMANKAVDISPYKANVVKAAKANALFTDYPSRADRGSDVVNFIDLL